MWFPFLKNPITLLFITGIFFSSCSIGGDVTPPAKTSGKLTGSVTLYNERDSLVASDGMTISIEGTSLSTITGTDGKFAFSDLPFNTYNFIYSKTGYGTFKLFKFRYSVDSPFAVIPNQLLGESSGTTVTSLTTTVTTDSVLISYRVSPEPTSTQKASIRLFFSTDAAVSSTQYMGFSKISIFGHSPSHTGFTKTDFYDMGFTSGQTIYVRCYGDSYFSNTYGDPVSSIKIFPNVNTTTVGAESFVLP